MFLNALKISEAASLAVYLNRGGIKTKNRSKSDDSFFLSYHKQTLES